jgi:hypothetical protein
LVNDQRDAQFFSMYFYFLTLYMFRAHQERQIVSIQPHVAVTLCRWSCRVQVVLTQSVSPDDEHDVLETCTELKINA